MRKIRKSLLMKVYKFISQLQKCCKKNCTTGPGEIVMTRNDVTGYVRTSYARLVKTYYIGRILTSERRPLQWCV